MKTKNGFTLVELLVVISIIALLLSILMPALNKVREQARTVVCGTNMRNLSQATMVYCADYKDNYMYTHCWPGTSDAYGSPIPSWRDYLGYYVNGKKTMEFGSGAEADSKFYKAFMCPSTNYVMLKSSMNSLYPNSNQGTQMFASYAYNQHLGPYLPKHFGKELGYSKQADVVGPAARMMFVDYVWNYVQGIHAVNIWGTYPQYSPANKTPFVDSYRHSNGFNLVMADGHVTYRKFKARVWGPDLMHTFTNPAVYDRVIDKKMGDYLNTCRTKIGEKVVKY